MPRRYYSSVAFTATLTADITNSDTSFAVSTVSGWPSSYPYTIIVDENTADEELMEVTNRSGTTLTVTRGVDGSTAVSHVSGASVKHGVSARDFDEPNRFLNGESAVVLATGSAAAPTLGFLNDSNTGFYSPGADQAAVSTGGVERIRWDANGATNLNGPVLEKWNVVGSAPPATTNIDILTAQNWHYTNAMTANCTLNFRGSSSVTLNSMLAVGQSVTVTFVSYNTGTGYYPSAVQVDGGGGVGILWQSGVEPALGTANAWNAYHFTIVKTSATPAYLVMAAYTTYA